VELICVVLGASFQQLPLSREQLRNEVDLLHDILPNIGSPVVFCHNDLLLRNVIYNEEQREYFLAVVTISCLY